MLVAGWSGVAMAQVNCETIRAGPDRTDCYIGVSRINREKSAIAAGVARQQKYCGTYEREFHRNFFGGTNARRAHTVSA
jgi:hypothetical protein